MFKILIVEDEKITNDLLSHTLRGLGFEVDQEYNGNDGLKKALHNSYHLILTDVIMPELDGLEMIKKLRNNGIKTPICILTSQSEQEKQLSAFKLGIEDYYLKPFTAAVIGTKIKNMLNRIYEGNVMQGVQKKIKFKNQIIVFTEQEYTVFKHLFTNRGNFISFDELQFKLFGTHIDSEDKKQNIIAITRSIALLIGESGRYLHIDNINGIKYEEE